MYICTSPCHAQKAGFILFSSHLYTCLQHNHWKIHKGQWNLPNLTLFVTKQSNRIQRLLEYQATISMVYYAGCTSEHDGIEKYVGFLRCWIPTYVRIIS